MSFIIDRVHVHAGKAIAMGSQAVDKKADIQVALEQLKAAQKGLKDYSEGHKRLGSIVSWICGDKGKAERIQELINKLEPGGVGAAVVGVNINDLNRLQLDALKKHIVTVTRESRPEVDAEFDKFEGGVIPKGHRYYDIFVKWKQVIDQYKQQHLGEQVE